MKNMFRVAAFVALFAYSPWATGQTFSSITRLTNCSGDRTIVRSNQLLQTVTCYHDSHNCSSFIVSGNPSKKFATSTYIVPSGTIPYPVSNEGYIVKDMEILDGVCWFCGEKWNETGNMLYTLEGLSYPEILHDGFVGRFNLADVLSGSGNFEIMTIPNTTELTHLAVYQGGITAIGESKEYPYNSCVVELQETSFPTTYLVTKTNPACSLEVFMDVTHAGNKVVTLSRYNATPTDSSYYKYCFGLRYGTPSYYGYTANTLYNYKTNKVFLPANLGRFYGLTPIFLTHTNNGNGVVVSYLGGGVEGVDFYCGRLLMAHIASIGASTVDTKISLDPKNTGMNTATGFIHGDPGYDCVEIINSELYELNQEYSNGRTFTQIPFTTSTPTSLQVCNDGVSNFIQPIE